MADLTITAANVQISANAEIAHKRAGATITAGQAVYIAADTDRVMLADSNSATAEARVATGIALNGASSGQPCAVMTDGDVTIGGTMTAGIFYYLSDTPGGICPVADVGSGEYPCTVGIAISTTVLRLNFESAGVAL